MIPEVGRRDGGGHNADAHGVTSNIGEGDTAFAQTIAAIAGDVAVEDRIEQLVPGAAVGRYVVLAKLGAGGMGEVFAAYDPELDRKVALKLLNPRVRLGGSGGANEARARLIREAQVLAKLNHPNIVAVHDAGEHLGAVWIAMEYVEGETLSAWLRRRRRSWHEVLTVMTPAARGLVAAHDAGLIHRDIKPDNIMVSTDGRVRVMDLGLARMLHSDNPPLSTGRHKPPAKRSSDLQNPVAGVTRAGALVGTPAYMSPEQFQGLTVDVRTDIFSYCAALWEALMGERPFAGDGIAGLAVEVLTGNMRPAPQDTVSKAVPRWLRRVCARGLAIERERRYATMAELLNALDCGQRRHGRRRWTVGLVAAATLCASVIGAKRYNVAKQVSRCDIVGSAIDNLWTEEARRNVHLSIVSTGVAYAPETAEKVLALLDRRVREWRESRTRVCLKYRIERSASPEFVDRARWCLDGRHADLSAVIGELSRADDAVMWKAVSAVDGIPPASLCENEQALKALRPPPVEVRHNVQDIRAILSGVLALELTGRYEQGLQRARSAVEKADALGWEPLIAEALHLEGVLLEDTGAYAEAEEASLAAYMVAAKAGAWGVAAWAARDLVYVLGWRRARFTEAIVWAQHAEVANSYAGDPLGLLEAYRLNNLGVVYTAMGAYPKAKALHERALDLWSAALGPEHPRVSFSLENLSIISSLQGELSDARSYNERATAILRDSLGPSHPLVVKSLGRRGILLVKLGELDEARALLKRSLADLESTLGPEHADVAMVLGGLAEVSRKSDEPTEARALYGRSLIIKEGSLGPDHPLVALDLYGLARLALEQRRLREALPLLARAVQIYDSHSGVQEGELDARLALARCLATLGTDEERAFTEAQRAAAGLRGAGESKAAAVAEAEALVTALRTSLSRETRDVGTETPD